ncbi:MAG: HAMP domain-containing protein [Rhodospirillales bacterium]|nr:HAMP domain-containing protein [Rhodospirillales bacterium]
MFDHLKVSRKLMALSAVFLLPVAFLAWLLVVQSQKDIHFAAKERDGGRYLSGLARLQVDLVTGWYAGQPLSALKPARDRVAGLEREMSNPMDTAELFAAMDKAAADLAAAGTADADRAKFEVLMTALRAVIGRVGDSSNLILDPDLDSYYAMDISLLKLPELVDASSRVLESAERFLKLPTVEVAQAAELLTRLGIYQGVADGVGVSLDSGYRGNVDGRMRPALDPVYTSFKATADSFGQALGALAKGDGAAGARADAASLRRLQAAVVKETDVLWKAVIAEMDRLLAQRIAGFEQKLWLSLGASFVVVLLALALAYAVARSISRPLLTLNGAMGALAGGSREVEVPFAARRDEVGDMARSLQVFKDSLIEADRMAEREHAETEERERRSKRLHELAMEFDARVAGVLKALEGAARTMGDTSSSMTATARNTAVQVGDVAGAVERTSVNVQTVASAAEELSGSIAEIGRQVTQASQIASAAVTEAERTNVRVQGLAAAADKIGEVVALITDIAEQTNLLALNATIEAARAGDAGKGFAVVASEVKNLANQTARATEEIGAQIAGIQAATQEAVSAIEEITRTIAKINEVNAGVASAVEEQGAATQEIARNVEQAASSTVEMGTEVGGVKNAVDQTGVTAGQVAQAANSLTREAEALKSCVDAFLGEVRAL